MLIKDEAAYTSAESTKRASPPPVFPEPAPSSGSRSYAAPTYPPPPPLSQNPLPHQCHPTDCPKPSIMLPSLPALGLSPKHLAKAEKWRRRLEQKAQKLEMKIMKKQERFMRRSEFAGGGFGGREVLGRRGVSQWGVPPQPSAATASPPHPPMTMMGVGARFPLSEPRAPMGMGPTMENPRGCGRRERRRDMRDMRRMDRLVERMQGLEVTRAFLDAAVERSQPRTVSQPMHPPPTMPPPGPSGAIPSDPPPAYTPRVPAKD